MILQGDIKFFYALSAITPPAFADIKIEGYSLLRDPGFETEVTIMLFTDARAGDEDKLPHKDSSRRGWWGDALLEKPIGSKLWLLERSKRIPATLRLAEQYTVDALTPMIDDDQADSVETLAVFSTVPNQIDFVTRITRDGKDIFFKYYANWQYQIYGAL